MIVLINNGSRPLFFQGIRVDPGSSIGGIPDNFEGAARRLGFDVQKQVGAPPEDINDAESVAANVGWSWESLPIVAELPGFSILVPTHQRLEELTDLINSIKYPEVELIIASSGDNASTVGGIVEHCWNTDIEVIVVAAKNHYGIGTTRNLCLSLATKPWSVIIDSDDMFTPRALEALSVAINQHPDADVIYGPVYIDNKLKDPPEFKPGLLRESGCYILGARCFRTSLLKWISFSDEYPFAEDLELLITLEDLGSKFFKVNYPLTIVRNNEGRVTRSKRRQVSAYAQRARS